MRIARSSLALAALAVSCLTGSAFADLAQASTALLGTTYGADAYLSSNFGSGANTLDGSSATLTLFTDTAPVGGNAAVTITYGTPTGGENTLLLVLGPTAGVQLTSVWFHAGLFTPSATTPDTGTGAAARGFSGSQALSAGVNKILNPSLLIQDGFAIGSYNRVTMFLTFAGTGSSIAFDYVSNPEPGTMALMGLGALGLGGLVVRRRRAAKRARA